MESRLQTDKEVCYLCNKPMGNGDLHHVFNGAYKSKSEEDGFIVYVHRVCHDFIHTHAMTRTTIKARAQKVYEKEHTREEFIQRYGKNYL